MILTPMVIADTPTCSTPNHGVMMVKAADLNYPDSAQRMGVGPVTILVLVTVNPDGSVAAAQISKSSSNVALDEAALHAAITSKYSPMIANCNTQRASATLTVDMAPAGGGSIVVVPSAPSESTSSCGAPNREPAITNAIQPDLTGFESHITGPTSVTLRVSLDPAGHVTGTDIVNSSGDRLLDDAVVRAARASTYSPRYVDCKAVPADYILLTTLH